MNLKSVRIWIMILGLWSGVQMLTPAHAYEGDHYVWTYYLARHLGYTHRQAFQLASATYAIDFDPNTGPMPDGAKEWVAVAAGLATDEHKKKWTDFHAFALSHLKPEAAQSAKVFAAERLRKIGDEQRNPGPFIHFMQDMYAHDGWDDTRGHGLAGHLPDFLSHDYPDQRRAKAMTQHTLAALKRFRSEVLVLGITKPVAVDPLIWTTLNFLLRADPLPVNIKEPLSQENVVKDFYEKHGIPAVLLAVPSLAKSLSSINGAIADEYALGRLEKFPHRSFLDRDPLLIQQFHSSADMAPVLPEKWKQYAFDRDGRGMEDGSYALENLQLHVEEPTVRVEIPTPELLGEEEHRALVPRFGDPERKARRVTIKVAYRLTGVVPDLGSLPIVERMELGESKQPGSDLDFQDFHGKVSKVRYVDQNTYERMVELAAFVNTESCEQNLVVLTTGLQVAGLEPVWRQHKLVTDPQQDQTARLRQACAQAGFARIIDGGAGESVDRAFSTFIAHASEKEGSLNQSRVEVEQFESPERAQAFLLDHYQLVGQQSQFGTNVTAQRANYAGYVEYASSATITTIMERRYMHADIKYVIVLDSRTVLALISDFLGPEVASVEAWTALQEKLTRDALEFGEPAMRRLTAALVGLGPANAPGYKLQRMPDPVFAASAPKTAVAPVPPSVAVAPKEIPPPNKSVSDLLAQTFGTHSGIRAGKLVLIEVERGSPGDNMGLGSGDRILRIGDKSLDGLMAAELQSLAYAPLRAPLEIELLRGRDQARVVVTLIERAPAGFTMTVTVVPGPAQ